MILSPSEKASYFYPTEYKQITLIKTVKSQKDLSKHWYRAAKVITKWNLCNTLNKQTQNDSRAQGTWAHRKINLRKKLAQKESVKSKK